MSTIADHRARVALVLGNRQDIQTPTAPSVVSRLDGWIRDSYIGLGNSYVFDTMEQNTSFTLNQGGGDAIPYPSDARAIKAITLYNSQGDALEIGFKDMKYIRAYSIAPSGPSGGNPTGPPAVVAFQNQQMFFRPLADQQYQVVIDYWQKPLITDSSGDVLDPDQSTVDISDTPLLLPDDWLEVLDYGAELRGHAELLERDKAQEIQNLLFGFTIPTTNRFVPGLIGQILTRRQAQAPYTDFGMQPSSTRRAFSNVP